MKKIVLLHYTAPPVVGGVENIIGQHAQLMIAKGHEVRVISGRGLPPAQTSLFPILIPLADSLHPAILAAKQQLDKGQIPANFNYLVDQLHDQLTEITAGADTIIAHNIGSLHKNLALTVALRQLCRRPPPPKLILWHHDLAWTTPRYQAELHPGWPWNLIRQDWPEVRPHHVVVSELRRRELSQLLSRPDETITVIPSGLDIPTFLKLEPTTTQLYHQLHLNQATPLLLLPVRITPRKNIEQAIHITAAIQKKFPKIKLIITGPPGPHNPANQHYFNQLKDLRTSLELDLAVHFLAEIIPNYLPNPIIADFYRLADALLLPSQEEGFGIPILEAGLSRLPIFCADIPPLHEIAGQLATYFSPTADPQPIANQLVAQLQNTTTFQLSQHIRQKYDWENIYHHQIESLL